MSDKVEIVHRREAARVNLRKMLDAKTRGERITALEIVEATGFDAWESFRDVIRRWAAAKGYVLIPVRCDGYRVGDPDDHVTVAAARRQSAVRHVGVAVRNLAAAPTSQLSDAGFKRYERELIATSRLHAIGREDDKAIRKEFKLGRTRVPLRLVEDNKVESDDL